MFSNKKETGLLPDYKRNYDFNDYLKDVYIPNNVFILRFTSKYILNGIMNFTRRGVCEMNSTSLFLRWTS
jgi:hypothetical protein